VRHNPQLIATPAGIGSPTAGSDSIPTVWNLCARGACACCGNQEKEKNKAKLLHSKKKKARHKLGADENICSRYKSDITRYIADISRYRLTHLCGVLTA
jgi:hypothetical protein